MWPFMYAGRVPLVADRWYGFSDSGGFYGSEAGYDSKGLAMRGIWLHVPDVAAAVNAPALLGSVACCVLTGKQFVDELYRRDPEMVSDLGHWSAP
jgi:hypothetical protein